MKWVLWSVAGLVTAFAASLWYFPQHAQQVSDVGTVGVGLAVCVAVLVSAERQKDRRRRRGLWFLMWSMASWTLGQAVWTAYELGLKQETPFPSMADVWYLVAVPLFAVALLELAPRVERSTRLRVGLDGLIMGCCTLFIAWAFVLGPVYHASRDKTVDLAAGLTYPLADILLVSLLLHGATRAPWSDRGAWWALAIALGGWSASDFFFAYATANDTYASGEIMDSGWFAALAFTGAAAVLMARRPDDAIAADVAGAHRSQAPGWAFPLGLAGLATAAGAWIQVRDQHLDAVLVWLGIAFVLLILARQAVVFLEVRSAERRTEAAQATEAQRQFEARFLNAAAHEMATPLTPLRMDVHRLSSQLKAVAGPALAPLEQTLAGIRRHVDRLAAVVEDLNRAASMQGGIMQFHPTPTDLAQIVRAAQSAEKERAQRRGVHVDLHVPPSFVAEVDPEAMVDAVRRMLGFAIQRSERDGTVSVRLHAYGLSALVTVADANPATEAVDFGNLFSGFANAAAGGPDGGLGLQISHGIIAGHGGSLSATKDLGPGVALVAQVPTVRLPRAR